MITFTIHELKNTLLSSGWTFHDVCAVKYVNTPFEVLDTLMPKLYEATGFDKYELFLEDVDDSVTNDLGEIIFDYTCWDLYLRRHGDSDATVKRALTVLSDIEGFINNIAQ